MMHNHLNKLIIPFDRRPSVKSGENWSSYFRKEDFVCVEVLRPSQPNGVMSSAVSLPNHTFTGQA